MFQTTRLKLTAWYLIIIMVISLLFSVLIYSGIDREFVRFERFQRDIQSRPPLPFTRSLRIRIFDSEMIAQARIRVIMTLGIINLSILGIAGFSGYFLARRTLRPIKDMVDEQNRFITDASHEMRTPLTSLRSEIEVELRNKNMTAEHARRILESNLEEVVSLQVLSDNLLELSQLDKQQNVKMVSVSIKNSIEQAIKKLNGSIAKKKIMVEQKVQDLKINGIPERITELFVILLDNAIKYSPAKSKVIITAKKTVSKVKIEVKDSGLGIARDDLPYIFDRFYRATKSRSKEKVAGYGLGLSIAKEIVSSHNGTIDVKSEIEHGTNFTVTFSVLNP